MSMNEANGRDVWSRQVERIVRRAIMHETGLPEHELASDRTFDAYGIESVMMVAITRRLEETFGELEKTLFFEFQNIHELSAFLAQAYPESPQSLPQPVSSLASREPSLSVGPQAARQTLEPAAEPVITSATTGTAGPAHTSQPCRNEPIAIIGMSGRFPMADNLDEFWANLIAGRNCISEVPASLWDWREYWTSEKGVEGKSYTRWGGFINDVDKFDPLFFNISHLEAQSLDPQERLFLETVYHTFEDAGYTRGQLAGRKVGVYAGAMWSQYQLYGGDTANAGSSYASIANRVSYWFDLTGPSIGLDTMCSSSLTTVHLACESLRRGETELAIAGGVNITVHPNKYLFLSKTGFASTEGLCRAYGEGGDGYVPGDGVGALLLKPLSAAERDGDRIHAVIRGSAINHGGKANAYTVPNPRAQASLIKDALEAAGVDPSTISYLEGHGTGTALGDPIEVRALSQAFGEYTDALGYCALGSVKSNIGHLESAAGFAGIAKVVLQMRHRQLVPSIHCDVLNKNIDFDKTPFFVQRTLSSWQPPVVRDSAGLEMRVPRRAGVSAFGAGGANGHVILEEYVERAVAPRPASQAHQLFVFSARNVERLHVVVRRFLDAIAPDTLNGPRIEHSAAEVLDAVARGLGVSVGLLDAEDSWIDLSVDEGTAAHLAQHLNQTLETGLSAGQVLQARTVGQLCVLCGNAQSVGSDAERFERFAYTLQVGREAQAMRLAVEADSFDLLRSRLARVLTGETDIDGVWHGPASKRDRVLADGEQDQAFLRTLARGRRWPRLARLWCQGASIPWVECYPGSRPRRVDLPLYPFARERCWVTPARDAAAAPEDRIRGAERGVPARRGDPVFERMFYHPQWVEQALPSVTAASPEGATVIVYPASAAFVADALKARLGGTVHEIVLGGRTEVLSACAWSVALSDEAALPICAQHIGRVGILYFLGGLNLEHWHPRRSKEFGDLQTGSVTVLLRLVQAIEAQNSHRRRWSLRIVGNAAVQIQPDDVVQPFTAGLLGFAKVLGNELPHIGTQWVDLALGEGATGLTPALGADLDRVVAGIGDGRQVALRGGRAYGRTLRPVGLPAPTTRVWRDDGVYLLIGGAGNVGVRISKYLANRCNARIAWIGRRVADESIDARRAGILDGASRVHYYQADIGDDTMLAATIQKIEAELGPLRGVFHSAMSFSGGHLTTLTEAEFHDALHAKTLGSHALSRALEGCSPDFVVFFSSGEAFVGNKGWGAYTVACNFQDAFGLHWRSEADWPVHVVNWGFWEGNERGDPELLRVKGIHPLDAEQGGEAIERLLASSLGQVMALNVSDAVLGRMGVELPAPVPAEPEPEPASSRAPVGRAVGEMIERIAQQARVGHVDPALTLDAVAQSVRAIVADTLLIERDRLDIDADLADFGVDSLIVVNLHRALEALAGTLPATLFLNCPSVHEVARYLIDNHIEQARKLLGGQPDVSGAPVASDTSVARPESLPVAANVLQPAATSPAVAGDALALTRTDPAAQLRMLRRIPATRIEPFLLSYGDRFRAGELAAVEADERGANAPAAVDDLLHLLVEVPSCPQVEVFMVGQGKPLVLMPAVALTAPVWLRQLESLRGRYRLIVVHAPGYGLSKPIRESTTAEVSRVFSEVLQRLIGAQPAHLVSSCFASIVASHLARFSPRQVASLTMVGGFYDGSDLTPMAADDLSLGEMMQMIQTASDALKLDFNAVAAQWERDDPLRLEAERMSDLLIGSQCANPLVAMRYLNEMITLSTLEWVRQIRVPVHFMVGDRDTVIRPLHSQTMHAELQGSTLTRIDGAAHYPFLTHPSIFDRELTRFIDGVDAGLMRPSSPSPTAQTAPITVS